MYHARFIGSHYASGFKWGSLLYKNNISIKENFDYLITDERRKFAKESLPIYERHYPEILEEIQGIAEGQKYPFDKLFAFLSGMYCFEFINKCTCFAFKNEDEILFGRNSDFVTSLEKSYMNVMYKLDRGNAFTGNTTAFVQMEDGVNEYGLAIGLTFIYPNDCKAGFNAGILLRYLLEKCKTTKEVIEVIKSVPIGSNHALTICDSSGNIAVIECSPKKVAIHEDDNFVASTNNFFLEEMQFLKNPSHIDDLKASERYKNVISALSSNKYSLDLAKEILSGKHGFMCQFDRKQGVDTVWSVVYDLKNKKIFRTEGNPSRKKYKEDTRFKFK